MVEGCFLSVWVLECLQGFLVLLLVVLDVTLNCEDWARIPLFWSSLEMKLTWKPELVSWHDCQYISG